MANCSPWTREETHFLIAEFKKHPILYKSQHPDRLNANKKKEAIVAIVDALREVKTNVNEKIVKLKLKTLNHQLATERKRMLNSNKSGSAIFKPTLWCFDELIFLMHANEEYGGTSNISEIIEDQKHSPVEALPVKVGMKLESDIERLHKTAEKSVQIMEMISRKEKECTSKEDAFCQYLSTELKSLRLEESFDEVQMAVVMSLQAVKAKERRLLQNHS